MNTNIEQLAWADIVARVNTFDTDMLLIVIDKKISNQFKVNELFKCATIFECDAGECLKTINMYEKCVEFFLEKGVHRQSHLIAIGGGSVSDFAGFVASSLLRGISWSVIPTTLLAMVDAAIGGKTGLNTKQGKNLIGTFHLPENVFLDFTFLETLEANHLKSGYGEILKYAFLSSNIKLSKSLDSLIYDCAMFKNDIVKKDFKEGNERKKLNLGHTFGHCIEKITGVEHGQAVTIGLKMIIDIYGSSELKKEFNTAVKILGIEIEPKLLSTVNADRIMDYLIKDKKVISRETIELIIPITVGNVKIEKVNIKKIHQDLVQYLSSEDNG